METVNKTEIGARIRKIRKELGLRQWQVAKMLGSTQPAVHKYETGAVPEVGRLLRLAEIGNTSVEWILTGRHAENGSARRERVGSQIFRLAERLQRISGEQKQKLESVLLLLEAALGSASQGAMKTPSSRPGEPTPIEQLVCDPQTVAALRSAIRIHTALTQETHETRTRKPQQSSDDQPTEHPLAARGL
jgi:transcriptional regulator with XRE-family HTH domain